MAYLTKQSITRGTIFLSYVRFQVLTAASMKIRAFWDVLPFSLVGVDRLFRGSYCLRDHGDHLDDAGSTHL
jgi:hypothetical protein